MDEKIYHRYLYLDTNIYGHICKNECLVKPLFEFLVSNNISLALTGANLSELHDAGFLHKQLVKILTILPTSLIVSWDEILKHEIESHPDMFKGSILGYPINNLLLEKGGLKKFEEKLKDPNLKEARKIQVEDSKKMYNEFLDLKDNFPPSSSGKYTKEQAKEFSDFIVIQWLSQSHPRFMTEFKENISLLNLDIFKTIKMFAFVIFYKYYIGNRNPVKKSDYGDLFHLLYIPYCNMAIMEKDICDTFNKIKRNESILNRTTIHDIRFFNDFKK
jgi:hypothetical protein